MSDGAGGASAEWRHSRRMTDWLGERMKNSDRVAVTVAGSRFAGLVEETSADLIALRAVFGRVDIHVVSGVPMHIQLDEPVPNGGKTASASRSFREVLLELDGRDDLTLGVLHDSQGLDGSIFVGDDFVSVVTRMGGETVVPLAQVAWIAPRRA
jgi:hypothetical protein